MDTATTPQFLINGRMYSRNMPLLYQGYDHIIENPELHNQLRWRYAGKMCLGARIADLAGGQWASLAHRGVPQSLLLAWPGEPDSYTVENEDGVELTVVHARERAIHLTGLTDREATNLFDACQTVAGMGRLIERIRRNIGFPKRTADVEVPAPTVTATVPAPDMATPIAA